MTSAPLTALPPFAEALHKLLEESKGRLAEVTATKDYAVQVKVAGESAGGNTWYATPVMSVSVATTGILIPMRGGNWYFQPLGIPRSVHEVEGTTPNILMDNVQRLKFGPGLNVSNWEGWLADVHVDTEEIASRAYLAANHPNWDDMYQYYTKAEVTALLAARQPRVKSFEQVNFISVSSAGTYVFGTPLTFSGLNPNAMYNVVFTVSWTVSATAARVATGTRFTNIWYPGGFNADHDAAQDFTNLSIAASGFTCSHQLQPTSGGVITIVPYARWTSGSLTIHRGRFVATVTAI